MTPDEPSGGFPLLSEGISDAEYRRLVLPVWGGGETGSFQGIDGIEIRYRYFRESGSQPAIVISSGRTESTLKYQELVYDLTRNGYAVYLWDHRGQGFSGKLVGPDDVDEELPADYPGHPSGHVEEFDHYVEDMRTYLDRAVHPAGHAKLFLLAHSMGGCVASLFLERYPDVFVAAALSSPMHQPGTGIAPESVIGVAGRVFALLDGDKDHVTGKKSWRPPAFEDNPFTHSQRRFERMVAQCTEEAPETQVGGPSHEWLYEAIEAAGVARRKAGKVRVPVLLIQAGGDTIVTAEGQNEFRDHLNQARPGACRFLRIENARHELFIESDEYRTPALTAILGFFGEHL